MVKILRNRNRLLFELSVLVKAVDGAIQLILAGVFYFVSYSTLTDAALNIFQEEIVESPDAFIWTFAERAFQDFTAHSQYFWATLLLVHGAIKMVLVMGLMKDKLWAYPAAIGAFSSFVAYQLFELSQRVSIFLTIVTAVDIFVIFAIYLEYRKKEERWRFRRFRTSRS